ncbi:DUF4142 domain-containing protein [Myxococcota bacterium]|nr:DUF4142 domain-containing protein [Myxococcota bacterium]
MRDQAFTTRIALACALALGASACSAENTPSAGRSATNQVGEGLDGGIIVVADGGAPSRDGGAVGDAGATGRDAGTGARDGGTGTSTSAGLTAEQLLAVLEAGDRAELDLAAFVEQCSTNPVVATFAQKMIADHTHFDALREALGARFVVRTATSAALAELERDAAATRARLETLSGDALDEAYVASQVEAHARVLALIDGSELGGDDASAGGDAGAGSAPDAGGTGDLDLARELRLFVSVARAELAAHLANAEYIARLLTDDDDEGGEAR